jgi:hypothetical protein
MPTCTVHVATRWDAVFLLRRLWSYGSWLYQTAPNRWLVTARPASAAALDEVLDAITSWARDAGRTDLQITLDGEHLLIDPSSGLVRSGTTSRRSAAGAGARPLPPRRPAPRAAAR